MSKFLQEMESRGLVKAVELSKGVLSITELKVEHEWYVFNIFNLFYVDDSGVADDF